MSWIFRTLLSVGAFYLLLCQPIYAITATVPDQCAVSGPGSTGLSAGVPICMPDNWAQMHFNVASGDVGKTLLIRTAHGSGEGSILHRFGDRPGLNGSFDNRSNDPGTSDTLRVFNVQQGWNYIHYETTSSFTDVTILVEYDDGNGGNDGNGGGGSSTPTGAVIDFESTPVGDYNAVSEDGYTISRIFSNLLSVVEINSKSISPVWGHPMKLEKADGAAFDLSSFNLKGRWPNSNGTVTLTGTFADGSTQQRTFTYTTGANVAASPWVEATLSWSNLSTVEFATASGRAVIDTIVMGGGTTVNQTPTASFSTNTNSGTAPLNISFNASASSDPDGSIQTYSWDFGDGTSGSGVSPSHSYSNPGQYTPRLTVTDNNGASATTSGATITVGTQAQGVVIDFESTQTGDYDAVTEDGYQISRIWSNQLSVLEIDTKSISPVWGHPMLLEKSDGGTFELSGVDLKGRWAGNSGSVAIKGIFADGSSQQRTFSYSAASDVATAPWEEAVLGWKNLESVEFSTASGRALIDNLTLGGGNTTSNPPPTAGGTANPNATVETKALFANLKSHAGTKTLIGDNALEYGFFTIQSPDWRLDERGIRSDIGDLCSTTQDYRSPSYKGPMLNGLDISDITGDWWLDQLFKGTTTKAGFDGLKRNHRDRAEKFVKTQHERGGITTLVWHMAHPELLKFNVGNSLTANETYKNLWTIAPPEVCSDIIIPEALVDGASNIINEDTCGSKFLDYSLAGSAYTGQYPGFKTKVDEFAAWVSEKLRDDEGKLIPVIFRPFHENNGDWFWWGGTRLIVNELGKVAKYPKTDPPNVLLYETVFPAIWDWLFNYLSEEKGLNNLLWAISPNGEPANPLTGDVYARYSPDWDQVDILGYDLYITIQDNRTEFGVTKEAYTNEVTTLVELAEGLGKIPAITEVGPQGYDIDQDGDGVFETPFSGFEHYRDRYDTPWSEIFIGPILNDAIAKRIAYFQLWSNKPYWEETTGQGVIIPHWKHNEIWGPAKDYDPTKTYNAQKDTLDWHVSAFDFRDNICNRADTVLIGELDLFE